MLEFLNSKLEDSGAMTYNVNNEISGNLHFILNE